MSDLIQKSIDISTKPFGLRPDAPTPVAPPAKAETVQTATSAASALRAKRRKGIAASVLAGQEGTGKTTLG